MSPHPPTQPPVSKLELPKATEKRGITLIHLGRRTFCRSDVASAASSPNPNPKLSVLFTARKSSIEALDDRRSEANCFQVNNRQPLWRGYLCSGGGGGGAKLFDVAAPGDGGGYGPLAMLREGGRQM